MNAVISLCHFCEVHGPSLMFCTQAFHSEDDSQVGESNMTLSGGRTPLTSLSPASDCPTLTSTPKSLPTTSKPDRCEACRSFSSGQAGYISSDAKAKVSYVSSQYPQQPEVFSMMRQACVRSLSCEVCPGREGPIFFGDDHRGHVLSYTFYIKDSQARGFQHWYSIIVVMMDKIYLLNSWPFLVQQIQTIIENLQQKASVVYAAEQTSCPPRTHRLKMSMTPSNFLQQRGGLKPSRPLIELINDPHVFKKLHHSFTWILKSCGNRLTERLLEAPPTEDSIIDFEKQEETEEGFVKLFTKKAVLEEDRTEDNEKDDYSPAFLNIRHLLRVVGYQMFHELAYHVLIGNQIIVKGTNRSITKSAINCLKAILPRGCCRVIYQSSEYEDSWKCNFLGLKPDVAIPAHVKLYVVLEFKEKPCVKSSTESEKPPRIDVLETIDLTKYSFNIKTPLPMPERDPAILRKIEFALMNENLADSVVDQCLVCLREEWMNKVKVLFKFTKAGGNRTEEDTKKLMQVVDAQDDDRLVLKFWMTGLSVQYRNHTLSSAVQQSFGF